jgi:ring-1,2-phenylacetyl-CoA epoxidase subunit PaaE
MEQNFALSQADVTDGYILTCQSRPTTPAVAVDYER